MTDFKVRRGPSSVLFSEPGIVNPKLVIEEGCWYLCTDTAELFLGITSSAGSLTLKRINGDAHTGSTPSDNVFTEDIAKIYDLIDELRADVGSLASKRLFEKISSENDLPSPKDVPPEEFNPNITYYIPTGTGVVKTFIFDIDTQSYLCNTDIDEDIILNNVIEVIDTVLDDRFEARLPEVIRSTLESTIIFGGTA